LLERLPDIRQADNRCRSRQLACRRGGAPTCFPQFSGGGGGVGGGGGGGWGGGGGGGGGGLPSSFESPAYQGGVDRTVRGAAVPMRLLLAWPASYFFRAGGLRGNYELQAGSTRVEGNLRKSVQSSCREVCRRPHSIPSCRSAHWSGTPGRQRLRAPSIFPACGTSGCFLVIWKCWSSQPASSAPNCARAKRKG